VVIFAAGVGAPYFTTDSGAALRAAEMKCDALIKGTSVDGIYSADPKTDPSAMRYDTIDYDTVLAQNLKVMDASAVALCRDNKIPIVVFSIRERGNLARVLQGKGTQTIVGTPPARLAAAPKKKADKAPKTDKTKAVKKPKPAKAAEA